METSRRMCNSPFLALATPISPEKNRSSFPANGLFGLSAPFATVFTNPSLSVNQCTIRLVSVSRVERINMAVVANTWME